MKKDIETIVPQTQSSIEDAIEEALLVAGFFDHVSRDEDALLYHLPPNSPLADHLETAPQYIDTSVSVEDLRLLEIYLDNRRG
jgi:hypothetical protein